MTPVEQIKERLSILDVVGSYVELHKAGKHYKGKSPFTAEKTPSFFVSPDRGMYYCFSTHKGGDIFTFVEEMEGVDFKGALKILADKAGVELVAEDPKKRDERETQYAILEEATKFFFEKREEAPAVTEYVSTRGVTKETLHTWRIGYAPDAWRALRAHLHTFKFTDAEILKAGLIKQADGGKEPYDVFRDRVMFPISDASGRVVAFSGRTLKKDDNVPKYVNSPETEFFQKSEILYGYDKAKHGIRHYDFSLIVEGQFDVVLAHQAGYTNTVAVSGTALSSHHVSLLDRLSSRAVLALDADRAGIAAVKRSSELMLAKGMDVKVAKLPEGSDPADMINADPLAFKKIIGTSTHVITFLLMQLRTLTKDERAYKLRAREEVVPLLVTIPNRIDREHLEHEVASALSTTTDAIHYEVERRSEATKSEFLPETDIHPETISRRSLKEELSRYLYALSLVLQKEHPTLATAIGRELALIIGEDEYKALEDTDPALMSELLFLGEKYVTDVYPKEWAPDISGMLNRLSQGIAKERLRIVRDNLREAEQSGDTALIEQYLKETNSIQAELHRTITVVDTLEE